MAHELYPLRFKEVLRNYSFGDRWITREFPAKQGLPENHRVAETWEVCDRPGESSVVTNGALAGRTLHELIERCGADLLGTQIMSRFAGRFPLLVKLLDASQVLGEQVHHSDELAARRGLADPGKTEAWYMLRTRAGGTIRCGNRDGVTREMLRQALLDGMSRECMAEHRVEPGDAFLLYAGTMHYSPGGQLFYEIMQNSDVYIGLGRMKEGLTDEQKRRGADEALEGVHLEEGFDCRTRPVAIEAPSARRVFVLACEHFALERLELKGTLDVTPGRAQFAVLTQIEGEATVRHAGTQETLRPGNTCLLPASLGGVSLSGPLGTVTLRAWVPDLRRDIVAPLRAAGVSDTDIVGLGGATRLNPLRTLLTRGA